jgi:sulfur-oxidizing protein SoxY
MHETRRLLLRTLGALAAMVVGIPLRLLAAWPEKAFISVDANSALKALVGASEELIPSDKIKLLVPETAENGAIVPLTVEADLPEADSIIVLASGNPHPLTSSYLIPVGTCAFVSTRIKMQESADVVAVVKAKGKYYSTSKRVKVAVGGCS